MSKYLPKAERMFQQKLKRALAPTGYVYVPGGPQSLDSAYEWDIENIDLFEDEIVIRRWRPTDFDFNYIAELFQQYGNYLLLIEDDNDVPVEVDAGAGQVSPS